VIDGREAFEDEDRAAATAPGWVCEHCGSTEFEPVVMIDPEPVDVADDLFE
jgi:hypothetical protein